MTQSEEMPALTKTTYAIDYDELISIRHQAIINGEVGLDSLGWHPYSITVHCWQQWV